MCVCVCELVYIYMNILDSSFDPLEERHEVCALLTFQAALEEEEKLLRGVKVYDKAESGLLLTCWLISRSCSVFLSCDRLSIKPPLRVTSCF